MSKAKLNRVHDPKICTAADFPPDDEHIIVPLGVTTIGNGGFFENKNIKTVTIPDTCVTIGDNAFGLCEKLQYVVLPTGLKHIGAGAFALCRELRQVVLPEGLEKVETSAFACTGLSDLTLPASLDYFSCLTCSYCWELKAIHVAPGNKRYKEVTQPKADGSLLLTTAGTDLLCVPAGMAGVCTVPEGVTIIWPGSFLGCNSLTEIELPGTVQTVVEKEFENLSSLRVIRSGGSTKALMGLWKKPKCYNKDLAVITNDFALDDLPGWKKNMLLRGFNLLYTEGSVSDSNPAHRNCLQYIKQHARTLWQHNICRAVILGERMLTPAGFEDAMNRAAYYNDVEQMAVLLEYRQRNFTHGELEALARRRFQSSVT